MPLHTRPVRASRLVSRGELLRGRAEVHGHPLARLGGLRLDLHRYTPEILRGLTNARIFAFT
jgi:hypothetical protein